jgi:hypothetical protein
METRSVWDYGLVSPKTIGRPALYPPPTIVLTPALKRFNLKLNRWLVQILNAARWIRAVFGG